MIGQLFLSNGKDNCSPIITIYKMSCRQFWRELLLTSQAVCGKVIGLSFWKGISALHNVSIKTFRRQNLLCVFCIFCIYQVKMTIHFKPFSWSKYTKLTKNLCLNGYNFLNTFSLIRQVLKEKDK